MLLGFVLGAAFAIWYIVSRGRLNALLSVAFLIGVENTSASRSAFSRPKSVGSSDRRRP
jgi:hypothetical protein